MDSVFLTPEYTFCDSDLSLERDKFFILLVEVSLGSSFLDVASSAQQIINPALTVDMIELVDDVKVLIGPSVPLLNDLGEAADVCEEIELQAYRCYTWSSFLAPPC